MSWHPQQYRKNAPAWIPPTVLDAAIDIGRRIVAIEANLQPVFTLRHLAHLTQVDYGFLRSIVTRKNKRPYKVFRIRKRTNRNEEQSYRIISVPDPWLMRVQRWINLQILACGKAHEASFAYERGSDKGIKRAAELHVGARWLIKLDVRRFFESISEIQVYRVFQALGYQPLISLEMARLCTRWPGKSRLRPRQQWLVSHSEKYESIPFYRSYRLGYLPQGAPTSPMLSNLVMRQFDEALTKIAEECGLVYTRYSDDICFSTASDCFSLERARAVVSQVYRRMALHGLSPNRTKTQIRGPGARKTVLGLLVDRERPRLPREFRDNLRQHIYYLKHPGFGPEQHRKNRGFRTVLGLRHYVAGLIAYAEQIDPEFAAACMKRLGDFVWPI